MHDDANLLISNYARRPITMVRGEGVDVWDDAGKRYLDLFAGFGGCVLGHCHPDLIAAAKQQADQLWHVGNSFYSEPQLRVARHLYEKAFPGKAFYCHDGMGANEAAVKLARRRGSETSNGRRYKVITFNASFHGRSLAMVSAGSTQAHRDGFGPPVPGFVHATGGDIDDLAKHVDEETCAVMFEPLRGEGGMLGYPDEFPRQVRELCHNEGISLIFDEVWTGGGRTGHWFGHQYFDGVTPDLMTLGKAVGGGLPVGICWAAEDHADYLVPGTHGSTLGGNPICMAVSATVFDVIERDNLLAHARELGEHAKAKLTAALPGAEIRGNGLFLGIDLPEEPTHDLVAAGLERGLIFNVTQKKVVRLAPGLVISRQRWDAGLDLLIDLIQQ